MEEPKKKANKPKKVGILFFLDGKRRNPVRRFCILTAAKELEYFSKDEYDPAAKVGTLTALDTCKVVVFEQTAADFQVTTAAEGVCNLQAQGGDQDRRNWVLEILKQRPIRGIVDLLHDEKLGAYAAYALANQCGGADELKLEIIQQGGLEPLLKFTKSSSDAALVGLIYYSLSKLSLIDQNKAAVGAHLPMLVELLRGDVAEYKAHALKTLVNLVTVPAIRTALIGMDGVRLLVRALSAVHASVQPDASAVLLNLVTCGDHCDQTQAEVMGEIKSLAVWVEGWAGLKEKDDRIRIYSAALVKVLQVLTVCCGSNKSRLEEGLKLIPSVCSVLPISKPECEAKVLSFLLLFIDDNVPAVVVEQADKLVASLDSRDKTVLTKATMLLAKVLAAPSLQDRESLWRQINPVSVVDHFSDADAAVRAASVQLFALLAAKPGAAAGLQRDASSFTKLGDALLADASLSRKLTASLASLSTVPEVKYALVTGSLRTGLLASMATTKEGAEVTEKVLEVFANCTSNAGARRALADAAVLCKLLDALKSPSQEVQTRIGSVLANLSTNSHIRRELRDMWALEPIFGAVMATKNRHLRMELMGAACNICFTGLMLSHSHVAYLISVLSSKSIKLRIASIKVLRNACLNMQNRAALVRLNGVAALLGYLPEARPEDQTHVLMVVGACAENDAGAIKPEMVASIAALADSPEPAVARVALRCLAAAADGAGSAAKQNVMATSLPLLFKAALGRDYVSAEHASRALKSCLVGGKESLSAAAHLKQVLAMCAANHPVVLHRALQILSGNAALAALITQEDRALLAALLDFPEGDVCEETVKLILGTSGNSGGGVVKVSAIDVLAAIPDKAALEAATWEVALDSASNDVRLVCPPLLLPFANVAQRNVFMAKLTTQNRARLHVESAGFAREKAVAGVAPMIEQFEALADYFKVVSELGRARSEEMESVMSDAAIAALRGEWAAPSGATRVWGAHSPLLSLSGNGVAVTYGAQYEGGPASVIVEGAPPHLGEFAYFEVLITACCQGGGVAVGMADSHAPTRLPGWAEGGASFGYHGDDGNLHWKGNNREFGPRFGLGDVVGCGVDEIKGDLFFTLNGRYLGVAASGVNSFGVRPCVGLVAAGQSFFTNFGQQPFLWDFSFVPSAFEPAPRSHPAQPLPYPSCETEARPIDPLNFAGGLWAAELALLYSRLCVVDPAVTAALQQTTRLFAKWKQQ